MTTNVVHVEFIATQFELIIQTNSRQRGKEAKMQDNLLLLLVCMFTSGQVTAEEESKDFQCDHEFTPKFGERLKLVSHVERLQTCHFIYTEENTGEQCCYNLVGREEDCETSDKYSKRSSTRCHKEGEFLVTVDSRGSGTCNLTIESVSEASAGQYRSYTADHELIQECAVKVKGEGAQGSVAKPVMAVLAILLAVTVAVVVTILVRRGSIKFTLVDGKESEREQLARCP